MSVKPWMLHLVGLMLVANVVLEPIYGPDSIPLVVAAVAVAFACRRAIFVLSRRNASVPAVVRHRHFV